MSTLPNIPETPLDVVGDGAEPPESGPLLRGGPIGRRITIALVGVSIFTLIAVGVVFFGFLGRYVVRREQDQMISLAVQVASQFERLQDPTMPPPAARGLRLLLLVDLQVLPDGAGITVWQGGSLLAEAGPPRAEGSTVRQMPATAANLAGGGPAAAVLVVPDTRERLLLAAAPISFPDGRPGVVAITAPERNVVASRLGLLRVLLLSGVIAIALALAVGFGLASWLSRPLRRLSRAARVMAVGSYGEAITGTYAGEVYDLAESLEVMRREVRRSEVSLRGFVASAAHELRTPLTSIEGFSQALLDGTAVSTDERRGASAAIYRESTRLHRLVDSLLILSRFDSREYRPQLARVDVGGLVREEAGRLVEAGLADAEQVRVMPGESVEAVTDPDMFRQVVANLLRNAVQYGGKDPVDALVAVEAGTLVLEVSNGGRPLGAEERARVFERFYRGWGASRTEGFGLGLPLVREICQVLGGRIELTEPDPRTTFRVTLPDVSLPSAADPG